ncbi:metallo-dependent hydrolase, subgroup D [Campylobacter iguaniorum]|uniref:Metallo-dependent hydrolase, subgroup D n=1 Tax=Campylobacter iguaniorum TaxID=1244531 RepID=A0A076FD08_9BACT|nr:metal-dependent hydrolase [Campylobacter iguaniorum]AII15277.1 metallo-dependent hydrolase, subgroup D [Campylobacter iguaniorum]
MKIIKAKYIITCNEKFDILEDFAVAFDEKIRSIAKFDELAKTYPNAEILDFSNDILMPAFINPHTHLEFSSNVSSLSYGDFINWLKSVINNRESLSAEAKKSAMQNAILEMMKSGVGTIGEISSFGSDIEICASSQARFVFFSEILGSSDEAVGANWDKFMDRFERANNFKSDKFIPAISVHSPYSTHPKLTKMALNLAKEQNLVISTHFLESEHEKNWLESGNGEFKNWLMSFNKFAKPMYDPSSFLAYFEGAKTLFTHCVFADDYLSKFDPKFHSITHCVRSNRLLSKKKLNLQKVLNAKIPVNIATDGLSSNNTLNFFDELRACLFTHSDMEILALAKTLLSASTSWGAKALGLENGVIEVGKEADISVFGGLNLQELDQLALQLILHTKEVKNLYIKGELCKF